MRTTPPRFPAGVSRCASLAALALRFAACTDSPGPTDDSSQPLVVPTIGMTTQVVPSAGLPREYHDLRAALSARSNNNLDVVRHDGRVYLASRLSHDHFASPDSNLLVFSSSDEKTWDFEAKFNLGTDLREPRFLSYRGRLFLYFAKLGQSPLSFEPQGMVVSERRGPASWSPPAGFYKPDEPYIPWRAKERNGTAYLVTYRNGEHIYDFTGLPITLEFLRSDDGLAWSPVAGSGVVESGGGSETDFELGDRGDLYAVTRNEPGDSTGWGSKICRAAASDLGSWSCVHDPKKYDSPITFTYGGSIYLIARRNVTDSGDYELVPGLPWSAQETLKNLADYSANPKRCSLWRLDQSAQRLQHVIDVPGWGDTCFPALLRDDADPGRIILYNYSSPLDDPNNADLSWHDGQVGETRIYRTELRFPPPRP